MAVDVIKGSHRYGFLNKVASAQTGSPHIYNVTMASNHDNFELVLRGEWQSFDNYKEDANGVISFDGVVRGQTPEGTWYIEVTQPTDALLVYNAPVSPYAEKEFQDESIFYNKAGETAEGFSLIVGDVFSVDASAFTGTIAAKKAVKYTNGKFAIQ